MYLLKLKSFVRILSTSISILLFFIINLHKVNAENSGQAKDQPSQLLLKVSFEITESEDQCLNSDENMLDLELDATDRKILNDHFPVIEDYFQTRAKRDSSPLLSLAVFATALVTIDKVYDLSGAPKMSGQSERRELKLQHGADKFQHFKLGEISYLISERVSGSPTVALAIGAISGYLPEIVENPANTGGKNNQDVIATSLGVLTKYISEQFLNGAFVTGLRIADDPNSFSPDFDIFDVSGAKPGGTECLPSTFTIGLNLNKLTGKKDFMGACSIVIFYELDAFGGGKYPIFPF